MRWRQSSTIFKGWDLIRCGYHQWFKTSRRVPGIPHMTRSGISSRHCQGYTHWGDAFHGYWAQDIRYLNRHFGSPDDLSALSQALHDRNMYLMVDVVANHLATQQVPQYFEPQYFGYGPFNSSDDFHPYCPIDYSNDTSGDKCWAGDLNVALADLNTDNPYVVNYLNGWIHDLVINYSVDAVRLDSARAIKQSFWPDFVDSAGVYNTGEIFDANVTYVASFQSNASLNPLNYPTYLALIPAFNGSKVDLSGFIDVVHEVQGNFTDTSLLPMFANNHDNPRFANITSDEAVRLLAGALSVADRCSAQYECGDLSSCH